ncbi:MAG TPA: hypothetical protein VGE97_00510, partial [Nitrososphaera sp.]
TVILAKEQQATSGNIVFWYIADPYKTPNGKSYSGDITCIDITGYKKWLWNKIRLLLLNTYYFSDDDLRTFAKFTIHPAQFQNKKLSSHSAIYFPYYNL